MNRRSFIRSASVAAIATSATTLVAGNNETKNQETRQFYEWRKYSMTGKEASRLDNWFKEVVIPFYNTHGVKVGAFGQYSLETPPTQYYLFVYENAQQYYQLREQRWQEKAFVEGSKNFFDASAAQPVYTNLETTLSEAIEKMPRLIVPDKSRTLIEYRTYWSPNEEANRRKVHMFNHGEIDVFNDCGVRSVMYGDIIAGPRMNALMYLTWYTDMQDRDKAWARFSAHPDWNKMKKMEQYANTATNNQRQFLIPLSYSQL